MYAVPAPINGDDLEILKITVPAAVAVTVAVLAALMGHVQRVREWRYTRRHEAASSYLASHHESAQAILTMLHADIGSKGLDRAQTARSNWRSELQAAADHDLAQLNLVATENVMRHARHMSGLTHRSFRIASRVVKAVEDEVEEARERYVATGRDHYTKIQVATQHFCNAARRDAHADGRFERNRPRQLDDKHNIET